MPQLIMMSSFGVTIIVLLGYIGWGLGIIAGLW